MNKPVKNRRIAPSDAEAPPSSKEAVVSSRTVPPKAPKTTKPTKSDAAMKPRGRAARFFRWVSVMAGVVVVVGASIGVAWGARDYLLSSPRFAIRTVVVDGAKFRTPEDIGERGGIEVGANIYALDVEVVAARIEGDPWIRNAEVVRRLPSTLHVAVEEYEASALVAIGDALYLATRDGEIFKDATPADPVDLAVITGIGPEAVAGDRDGVEKRIRQALDVVDEASTRFGERYPVQEVHYEVDGKLQLIVGRQGITIFLGQAPYRGKLEQAERVLTELRKRKGDAAVIFLDNDANPERVVVRMR